MFHIRICLLVISAVHMIASTDCSSSEEKGKEDRQPNIVFIMSDDDEK